MPTLVYKEYGAKLPRRSNEITTVLYVGNDYAFINFTCTLNTYIALSWVFNYCNWYKLNNRKDSHLLVCFLEPIISKLWFQLMSLIDIGDLSLNQQGKSKQQKLFNAIRHKIIKRLWKKMLNCLLQENYQRRSM